MEAGLLLVAEATPAALPLGFLLPAIRGVAEWQYELNIKAAVGMHPWIYEVPEPWPHMIEIPFLYLTGTEDVDCPNFNIYNAFKKGNSN